METPRRVKRCIINALACLSSACERKEETETGRRNGRALSSCKRAKRRNNLRALRVYVRLCVLTRRLFRCRLVRCTRARAYRGSSALRDGPAAAGTVLCIERDLRNGGRYKERRHTENSFIHDAPSVRVRRSRTGGSRKDASSQTERERERRHGECVGARRISLTRRSTMSPTRVLETFVGECVR